MLQSQILAYFPADQDVGEALAMAAESAGLKSMPSYKVEKVKEANWVQQVQVSCQTSRTYYIHRHRTAAACQAIG